MSNNLHRGTLYLRFGPMYASKSTWLNGQLTKLADLGFSVVKIIHSDDIRIDVASADASGSSHHSSFKGLSNKIKIIRTSTFDNLDLSEFNAIGIDEAQFFYNLRPFVEDLVENEGKHVRVVGLDGDSNKEKFGDILMLIPLADKAKKDNAVCKICLSELKDTGFKGNILGMSAPFTKRLDNSSEQKLVGGHDKYIPVCRFHHCINYT